MLDKGEKIYEYHMSNQNLFSQKTSDNRITFIILVDIEECGVCYSLKQYQVLNSKQISDFQPYSYYSE